MKTITIVGLGEVGSVTFTEMARVIATKNLDYQLIGVDINSKTAFSVGAKAQEYGANVITQTFLPEQSDVWIICIWDTATAVQMVSGFLPSAKEGTLVSFEMTLDPKLMWLIGELQKERRDVNFVHFPHRFNPNDPNHKVFNLDRVLGADSQEDWDAGLNFYWNFMDGHIYDCYFKEAVLVKVVENAYRYMEIVLAQELKRALGDDFERVRRFANTKWNIDIREALSGVGGKCLPKDMNLFFEYVKAMPQRYDHSIGFLSYIMALNASYKSTQY